eukprot:jgi/Mesen1/812/ME000110S_11078
MAPAHPAHTTSKRAAIASLFTLTLLLHRDYQVAAVRNEPLFEDVSHLIVSNSPALRYGVCATDVDGDGRSEFFVCGFGSANMVLKWEEGRGLIDIAGEASNLPLADPERHAIDIDRDGQEEIYVLNTDTFGGRKRFGDRLFNFVNSSDSGGGAAGGKWIDLFGLDENRGDAREDAGDAGDDAGDAAGDGRGGAVSSAIVDVAEAAGLAGRATGGRACAVLPLVSASASDVFAGNEHGPNFLFVNRGDGSGIFDERAAEHGLEDSREHVRGVAALDVEGTGHLGLAYGNWEGPHRLISKRSSFSSISGEAGVRAPSRVRTVIAADFDNDGYEELFFNNIGEPNRVFCQESAGRAAEEARGLGTGAAVGDVDGDGFLELLVSHGESGAGQLSLYRSPRNGNAWLRVKPLTRFGAPARAGAGSGLGRRMEKRKRLRRQPKRHLQEQQQQQRWSQNQSRGQRHRQRQRQRQSQRKLERRQIRVIDGGSGYLCCMEPVAHFGLGGSHSDEELEAGLRVRVVWPDGATAELEGLRVRTEVVVEFPLTQ